MYNICLIYIYIYIYIYIDNKNDDEWGNLQSKLKEYVNIHEINGWENILQNEIMCN